MSPKVAIGDRVHHYRYGKGRVSSVSSLRGVAEVAFPNSTEYVETKNLTLLDLRAPNVQDVGDDARRHVLALLAEGRCDEADRLYQRHCRDNACHDVLNLIATRNYEGADRLYQRHCADWWPIDNYETIKTRVKKQAEAAERTRQEQAENRRLQEEENRRETQARREAAERRKLEKVTKRLLEEEEKRRTEQLIQEAREQRARAIIELNKHMLFDFRGSDACFHASYANVLSREDFEKEKADYVKAWISEHTPPGERGRAKYPDDEQAAAISAVHGHIQVVARAGSGKTATLVNRALFLLGHCGIAPSEILILAFNRKAALEIRRRLLGFVSEGAEAKVTREIGRRIHDAGFRRTLDKDDIEAKAVDTVAAQLNVALPHVMTFHALAHALVHPEESLLYDDAESGSQALSRVVQNVIDDHLQKPAFKEKIRELMLAHFRTDWDRIVEGHYEKSKKELLLFRRSLPRESLAGEFLKSSGEKIIADFLFEHDIAYKYERSHWWHNINYRPDFTIFPTQQSGLIIEYFGLVGDSDYDETSDAKRAYWSGKPDWTLLEFYPSHIAANGVAGFRELLKSRLEDHGRRCTRLSENELWHRVRDRAIDRFSKAIVGFIGRCRKQSLSSSALRDLIDSYRPASPAEALFLELAHRFYEAYLHRLAAAGEEDFDGLMQRAALEIDHGQTSFERRSGRGDIKLLRYVFIDEFQDFSDLFYRLLNAVRKQNPQIELFCVGDDWQAINGFAGSDLRFFENFAEYMGESRRLNISTNYRSSISIVAVGNALMEGLGQPAKPAKESDGTVLIADLNGFEPSLIEKQRHPGDLITPAVLRICGKALGDGLDVAMLCRQNTLPWFVNYREQRNGDGQGLVRYLDLVRSYFPKGLKERITISTVHKYKGLEKQAVIVLDAVARSYPLIHPDWVFSRVLGDNPEKIMKEERRLFYVALTRAVAKLVIITDGRSKSPFLEELENRYRPDAIKWVRYPPALGVTSRLIVKVGNQSHRGGGPTIAIKDLLRASGYQYQSTSRSEWVKSFPAEGFSVDVLKAEIWSQTADGVAVSICDGAEEVKECYAINEGQWTSPAEEVALF